MLRIAHVTDIHLAPETRSELYGVGTGAALEQVLDDLVSLPRIPDLIVATGDLADDAAQTTYARLRGLLSKPNIATYVLPGNHDNPSLMRTTLVSDLIHFESHAQIAEWMFVFVDSKVPGKDYGYVSPDELLQLERNLKKAPERYTLVALHHTPTPRGRTPDCQLTNTDELMGVLEKYRAVKCTIAGHTHTAVEEQCGHLRQFTTPSTFAHWAAHKIDGSMHGYRIMDLLPDGNIHTEVRWV